MTKKDIHVVPHEDGWAIRREGNSKASAVFDKKADAMGQARDWARQSGVELVPHGRNGRIQNPNSYGNDPNPPRDRRR